MPKTNSAYWQAKLIRTAERDQETNALLDEAGWTVLRFYEHEDAVSVAAAIVAAVSSASMDR